MDIGGNQQLLDCFTEILVESGRLNQELCQYCSQLEELRDYSDSGSDPIAGNIKPEPVPSLDVLDALSDAIAIVQSEQITYANPAFLRLFRYQSADALLGQSWQVLFPEDEASRIEAEILPELAQSQQWNGETYAHRQDRDAFIGEFAMSMTHPKQMVWLCRDMTQQAYADSWQDTQTTILKQLATGTPIQDVLEAIIDGLECHLLGGRSAVLLIDAQQQLHHDIAPNLPIDLVEEVDGAQGLGSLDGINRPLIVSDLATHSLFPELDRIYLDHGIQSCWFFPIFDSHIHLIGVIAAYFPKPRTPSEPEQKFIDIALDLAGLALEQHQVRHQQTEAAVEIQRNNNELQAMFASFPDLLLRINRVGTLLTYKGGSPQHHSFEQPEPFLGKQIQTIFPPEIADLFLQGITAALNSQDIQEIDYSLTSTDTVQYFEARLLPAEHNQVLAVIRNVTDRKRAELALSGLFKGTSGVTGADFFPILVQQIATTLDMSEVMLSKMVGDELSTVAFFSGGEIQPNLFYPIAKTPCELTLRDGSYSCLREVQSVFPEDPDLQELSSEGYIGFVLHNAAGEPIGVLCCLSRHPIQDVDFAYSILQIFGARAGAELERLQMSEAQERLNQELETRVHQRTLALKQSQQDLRTILNTSYEGIYIHTVDGQLIDVNQRVLGLHGLSRQILLKKNVANLWSGLTLQDFQACCRRAAQGMPQQFEAIAQNFEPSAQGIPIELTVRKVFLNQKSVLITTLSDISERKQQQKALESIVEGTADKTGIAFYRACVKHLAEIFQVQYAFVAQLKDETLSQSRILAMWTGDRFAEPYDFELAETPCLQTYQQDWCIVPHSLGEKFPKASQDASLCGESYISCQIKTSSGRILGNLGIIDAKSLPKDTRNMQFVLQLFAARVGAEMERQASEDALRQSQKQLQAFIDNSPAAIYLKDLEGRYLIFNKVLGRLFDIDAESFLGKTDFDLFPSHIAEMLRENDRSIMAQGHPQTLEEEVPHGDGSRHTYIATKFPVYDAQGNVYALGGVSTDISDRILAEEKLRESQQLLTLVIDNIPQSIYWKDHDSIYLGCNQNFADEMGLDAPDQVIGKTDADLNVVNRSLAECLQADEAVLSSGIPELHGIQNVKDTKGDNTWTDTNKIPLRDVFGNTVGLLGTYEDISDRKQLEGQLQLTQFSIDNAADSILWIRPNAQIAYANSAACQRLGYTLEDLQTLRLTDIDEGLTTESWPDHWQDVWVRQSLLIESVYQTKSGTTLPVEVSVNYLDYEGEEYHFLQVQDISDRKAAEQSLVRQAEVLQESLYQLQTTQTELAHNELTLRQQADALLQLSRIKLSANQDLIQCLQELTEVTAQTLQVGRVSIWLLDPDHSKISCTDLFESEVNRHSQGMELLARDYPSYFVAIANEPILAAADAYTHPATCGFSKHYLKLLNIGAMLDSSFLSEGTLAGVVCCEHIGASRTWTQSEQTFVRAVSNLVSLFVEADKRQQQSMALTRALNELRESKQFLELVFDTLPQRVFWKDRDLNYLGCNKLFLQDAGLNSLDQIMGKSDWDMIWREQADAYRADDALVIDQGTPRINYEEEQPRDDGSISWVRTNKIPLRDAENNIIGVFGSYEDITPLKEAEQTLKRVNEELEDRVSQRTRELQESQQLLQLVMDTIPQSIFWKDRDFRFLGCNESFLLTTGLDSAEELIGKTDYDMPWSAEADWYRQCDQQIMETQVPELALVEPLPQADGGTIWLETNKAPFYDSEGDLIGVLGTFHDITQRKRAEEALQTLNQELKLAKEAADAANRAKSEFLANMSHELRTPLNGILGYAQILKRDRQFLPHHRQALETIHQSGEHLLTLINDILDIAKIEARKLELDTQDVHFPCFLENIVKIMQMQAQSKHLQLSYQPSEHLPKGIRADEKRLRQVLLNLLSNAIKFTDQGQVTLSVEIEPKSLQQVILKFAIADTGIGIAPAQLEQIFYPFEQVGELHRRAEGTGLGLSISRQLIDLMGGTLQVESHLEQGTTFWFTAPFSLSNQFIPTQVAFGPIVGYTGARRRLLIVDDSLINRSVLVSMLDPLGFDLRLAQDGQDGLNQALEYQPDLILTDLVMPNLDGWAMIKEIRQHSDLQETPIFAISANVQAVDQLQSQSAGCDAFIPKPIDELVLFSLMAEYLQLEWQFESMPSDQSDETVVAPVTAVPPQDDLQKLYQLAILGNMTQLRHRASHLAQTQPQFLSFAERLITLAQNFEDEQIMAILQQYLPHQQAP